MQAGSWRISAWSELGSGIGGANHPSVSALAVSGSVLYAAGYFTTVGGGDSGYSIAKWNGSTWTFLPGITGGTRALAGLGSDLYAGGYFTTAGAVVANNIAKWNGSAWSGLGSGVNGDVWVLAVSATNLYAGGAFTAAGGVAANGIAKWDGSTWSPLGSGVNGTVYALAVSGTDVYAGGAFSTAGGVDIAKWNGSSWSALGSGMNAPVRALAVWGTLGRGNSLYAGGEFTTAGGKFSAYVARGILGDAPGYNRITTSPVLGGELQFSYIGYPATNYVLDRTFNLAPPVSWVAQETNTMSVSGVLLFTNTPVSATNNFWRVRSAP